MARDAHRLCALGQAGLMQSGTWGGGVTSGYCLGLVGQPERTGGSRETGQFPGTGCESLGAPRGGWGSPAGPAEGTSERPTEDSQAQTGSRPLGTEVAAA